MRPSGGDVASQSMVAVAGIVRRPSMYGSRSCEGTLAGGRRLDEAADADSCAEEVAPAGALADTRAGGSL